MAIIGTAIAGALGAFGDKPRVPTWQNIDLAEQQQAAIGANLDALPGAQNLADQTTRFNLEQIQEMLEFGMPGYSQISGQATDRISSFLKGEIPQDVSDRVANNAAVQALQGGYSGSGMGRNLLSRDLGLTSLDMIGKGLSSAESWMRTTDSIYGRGMFDVSSMFISPMQKFQTTFANQEQKWNQQWLKNQVSAAPDPFMRALGQAFINDEDQITGLVGSAAGAASGGSM